MAYAMMSVPAQGADIAARCSQSSTCAPDKDVRHHRGSAEEMSSVVNAFLSRARAPSVICRSVRRLAGYIVDAEAPGDEHD